MGIPPGGFMFAVNFFFFFLNHFILVCFRIVEAFFHPYELKIAQAIQHFASTSCTGKGLSTHLFTILAFTGQRKAK